jgi:hypothetical protein
VGLRPQPRAGYLERVAGRFEQPVSLLLPPRVLPFRTRSPRAAEPETPGQAPRRDVGGLAPASPPAGSGRGAVRLPQAGGRPAPVPGIALTRGPKEGVAAPAESRPRDLAPSMAAADAVAGALSQPASRAKRYAPEPAARPLVEPGTPAASPPPPAQPAAPSESIGRRTETAAPAGRPALQRHERANARPGSSVRTQDPTPRARRPQPAPAELLAPPRVSPPPALRASASGDPEEAGRRQGGRPSLSIGTIEVVVTPPPSPPSPLPGRPIAAPGRGATPPASRAGTATARLARGYLNSFGLRQG